MTDYAEQAQQLRRQANKLEQDAEAFRAESRQTCFDVLSVVRHLRDAADQLDTIKARIFA